MPLNTISKLHIALLITLLSANCMNAMDKDKEKDRDTSKNLFALAAKKLLPSKITTSEQLTTGIFALTNLARTNKSNYASLTSPEFLEFIQEKIHTIKDSSVFDPFIYKTKKVLKAYKINELASMLQYLWLGSTEQFSLPSCVRVQNSIQNLVGYGINPNIKIKSPLEIGGYLSSSYISFLAAAAFNSDVGTVNFLIKNGADVDSSELSECQSPLSASLYNPDQHTYASCKCIPSPCTYHRKNVHSFEMALYLLKKYNADPKTISQEDLNTFCPYILLRPAAQELLCVMVEKGLNPNECFLKTQRNEPSVPLLAAAVELHWESKAIKILLDHGADPETIYFSHTIGRKTTVLERMHDTSAYSDLLLK